MSTTATDPDCGRTPLLSFENDYSEGACPEILQRLLDTNYDAQPGYGSDDYCASAVEKIRAACAAPDADVRFLVGGTQTNQIVIDALLDATEGAISAETGHINAHEAGAVEFTGHKVLAVPQHDGKVSAADVDELIRAFYVDANCEHMVFPGMVYVSHPTEYGTLYSLSELTALSRVCREHGIPLFLDGARLGYALASPQTDMTLPDIARLCDAFYIGGTKVGALCGEAVVFPRHGMPRRFLTTVKQHGGLLAKGRLLGLQFDTLFTDGLYFALGAHAMNMAALAHDLLAHAGCEFYLDSPTNQLFIVLDQQQRARAAKRVRLGFWENLPDGRTVMRVATSWATREESVRELGRIMADVMR